MNQNDRMPSRKRHIAPAILGAGISLVGNIAGSIAANKQAKKENQLLLDTMWQNKELQDTAMLGDYPINGIENVDYYAKGGMLPDDKDLLNSSSFGKYETQGGNLVPIADGVEKVVGNKHGSNKIDGTYGVKLSENGVPVAEVEGGEVIADGEVVFSDRLMYNDKHSFADKMEQISDKRNRLDKKLEKAKLPRQRNTVERELSKLNMAEDVLYTHQEAVKMKEGQEELKTLANGGLVPDLEDILGQNDDLINKRGYGNTLSALTAPNAVAPTAETGMNSDKLSDALSLGIDNVSNFVIGSQAPTVPMPRLTAAPRLETNVNVAPQVAAVKDAVTSTEDAILSNTSNSNIARSNIASARSRGARNLASIYGQEENAELQLRNRNAEALYGNQVANNALVNETALLQAGNEAGNLQRLSANINNIAEDVTQVRSKEARLEEIDNELMTELQNDITGQKKREYRINPYIQQRARINPALNKLING